jgi:hypothetical protein
VPERTQKSSPRRAYSLVFTPFLSFISVAWLQSPDRSAALFNFALAGGMLAFTVNVRGGFHRFALDAAILSLAYFAAAGRMSTLLVF